MKPDETNPWYNGIIERSKRESEKEGKQHE